MIEIGAKLATGLIPNVSDWQSKPIDLSIEIPSALKGARGTTPIATEQNNHTGFGSLNIVVIEDWPPGSMLLVGAATVVRSQRVSGKPSSVDITLRVSAVGVKNLQSP